MSSTRHGAPDERDTPGEQGESLEHLVHALLTRRGETVAVAESLTGGLVGERISATPGASATFRGGVIAYATDVKASVLGVPLALLEEKGAVDSGVARAMASGVRDLFRATYGLGLTGVAGPDPQDGHPPGVLHVALAGPEGHGACASVRLVGDRTDIRQQAAVHALRLLHRHLLCSPLP